MSSHDPLDDYQCESMTFDDRAKDVYSKGSGPAVVIMTEIPGITPEVADFGRRVADAGFTVFLPDLFGTPGKPFSNGYAVRSIARACVSREFVAFAKAKSSPVTTWLRELIAEAHQRCGGEGVGLVGMCFTGGFALALAVDPLVKVPVMSQPSLPFGLTKAHRQDLGLSDDELAVVQERVATDDLCVIGLRFSEDPMVPRERFVRLRAELGDGFLGVEIDNSPPNPYDFPKNAHSVLTTEYRDDPDVPTKVANDLVIQHFLEKL